MLLDSPSRLELASIAELVDHVATCTARGDYLLLRAPSSWIARARS
jgi:hypothetical protein